MLGQVLALSHQAVSALFGAQEVHATARAALIAAQLAWEREIGNEPILTPYPLRQVSAEVLTADQTIRSMPAEVSSLAGTVSQLAQQVASLSRQVQAVADRPTPRPQRPATNSGQAQATAQTPAAPRSYAQAAAQPAAPAATPAPVTAPAPTAGATTTTTTTTTKPAQKQRRAPPPPKMYAKDPTLVFVAASYMYRKWRRSDAAITAAVREFFSNLPTAERVTVLSAVFNTKGNIVCTFAPRPTTSTGPSVESLLDRHAVALGAFLRQPNKAVIGPPDSKWLLTPTRVRPRATLRCSMVPTRSAEMTEGATYSSEVLLDELLQNPVLKGLEFVIPPHYTCDPDRLPKLEFCPVSFTFTDLTGETRARLLKKPRVWLFGKAFRLSVPPQRPAFTQCTKCQALGHTSTRCKAPAKCAYCAGKHATTHHRARCLECAREAIPADQACPHPLICANCKGEHMSTSRDCPRRKKYAPEPADDSSASSEDMET